ncbi:riboflavin biosynthesis protein RibF [Secundilactobacillus pentosiphilus]|uniref:Riboflavin biosynthesis protein n=1 Tax=Secundilactobacillus pentosiphilus TaxID=1714682 RepID=A0A1Z5IMK1_9LACO|nr:riboflavin biosynthesis protein RibF [Secundilactobacillus pentosiphilus]GAX02979.1 riboflavin biosynthesis protein RibF [Secundilactobacillus pentosiphilus]GAX05988.1 riboflavin biosynthesis protein RibF [Secundilactobacillus pentosiphilus]
MQVIQIHHPLTTAKVINQPVVLAMGFFDGVHLGHQAVINRARAIADERGLALAILTYDHHPALVYQKLSPERNRYLTVNARKMALFEQLGVDIVYQVNFASQFADQTPQEFVDNYLLGFHAKVVVAGYDHTYGPKDIATMANLPKYAKGRFEIVTVGEKELQAQKIGSSRIRRNLDQGHIRTANSLFGYRYQTTGTVMHGEARGRTLGFPTANISHDAKYWLPGIGVYVTRVKVNGQWYPAMTSIGRNVTFGSGRPVTVEAYLLDFKQAIYGEVVTVEWDYRLRGEIKFNTADDLVQQLKRDAQNTEAYFTAHPITKLALE